MNQLKLFPHGFGKYRIHWLLSLVTILSFGCVKVPDVAPEDEVITITLHDKNKNFADFKTFSINDTVSVITDGALEKKTGVNANQVISNIAKNMTSRGFTQVNSNQNPDIVVNLFAIKITNVSTYYPGYWYGYGGYYPYYPYYPYYYSYYYPWTYTYTYNTGGVFVEFIDFKHRQPPPSNVLSVMWSAFINGYVDASVNPGDINKYIDQAFEQSPYIKTN